MVVQTECTLLFVAGTRPNFMKVAPLLRECKKYPQIKTILVHTGQHYDETMSKVFFDELEIQTPDLLLKAGEYSDPISQKKYIRDSISHEYEDKNISAVVVVGDVNSTAGGALAGQKMGVPVAHVEAGLRSYDDRMPEEHNRILVDKIASIYFVTEPSGMKNLKQPQFNLQNKKAFLVGNVMIDTLLHSIGKIKSLKVSKKLELKRGEYVLLTLHRKENLEEFNIISNFLKMIKEISLQKRIVWPMHPRTKRDLEQFGLLADVLENKNILVTEPVGYFELVSLISDSLCVVTDSGGMQDETTTLNIPCLTIRRTTERPITTTVGSSTIIGEDGKKLLRQFERVCTGRYKKSKVPMYWDGNASERIVSALRKLLIKGV